MEISHSHLPLQKRSCLAGGLADKGSHDAFGLGRENLLELEKAHRARASPQSLRCLNSLASGARTKPKAGSKAVCFPS